MSRHSSFPFQQLHFAASTLTLNPPSTPWLLIHFLGFISAITGRQCTRTPASFCIRNPIRHYLCCFRLRDSLYSFSLHSIHISGTRSLLLFSFSLDRFPEQVAASTAVVAAVYMRIFLTDSVANCNLSAPLLSGENADSVSSDPISPKKEHIITTLPSVKDLFSLLMTR